MSFKAKGEIIKFGNIPKAIQKGNENAILELVTRVTAHAKLLAPVDTGELRGSIMGRVEKEDVGHQEGPQITVRPKLGQGYVGTAVQHGIYQEFGTRKMAAQPYLRPAIDIEANGRKASAVIKKYEIENVNHEVRSGTKKRKQI